MSSLFYVSYAFLWLLLLTIAVLVLLLYRHFGLSALATLEGVQRDGLGVGELAPALGEDAATLAEDQPHFSTPVFLFFAKPACEPCEQVLPVIARLANHQARKLLSVIVVVEGAEDAASDLKDLVGTAFPVLNDRETQAFDKYRVRVTPFAFVIGGDGRVRSKGLCGDTQRLRDLLLIAGLDEVVEGLELEAGRSHARVGREER